MAWEAAARVGAAWEAAARVGADPAIWEILDRDGEAGRALHPARRPPGHATVPPKLRAAMSMALLPRDQGKREEARDLLALVYGWFTEGFDTLDLKEAKALLDELSS